MGVYETVQTKQVPLFECPRTAVSTRLTTAHTQRGNVEAFTFAAQTEEKDTAIYIISEYVPGFL